MSREGGFWFASEDVVSEAVRPPKFIVVARLMLSARHHWRVLFHGVFWWFSFIFPPSPYFSYLRKSRLLSLLFVLMFPGV